VFSASLSIQGSDTSNGETLTLNASFNANLTITGDPTDRSVQGLVETKISLTATNIPGTNGSVSAEVQAGMYFDLMHVDTTGANPNAISGKIKARLIADISEPGQNVNADVWGEVIFDGMGNTTEYSKVDIHN
jgi:hypothetical protein